MFAFSADEWEAVRLSLKVGLVSVAFSLPIGFRLYRNRQGLTKGKKGKKLPESF